MREDNNKINFNNIKNNSSQIQDLLKNIPKDRLEILKKVSENTTRHIDVFNRLREK